MHTPDDFTVEQAAHGELEPGQVRVANEFISVDPYMRGRMRAGRSYVQPYGLGESITGGAVGRVVESARYACFANRIRQFDRALARGHF